ncbi:50S ribosomal protein L10 [Flavilitoribacter nigricans]|uniref:Large ribosomal subunit protein uL10 n=1 Tax=Flavilitoribacter nigricans (strain ATCC 23147 / DSM 23189 / NBRC 102662 / NCIMB 1420 / SS-2) TaxID=1122177 RepID=A0A2D0N8F8_FLAN2|nr:50S ribosomal protein L10 [Flavilitoribacter nigricans]PHN04043.1 50S ribosomal protein L10 [Flavilitoribacter nigricans DSM 23189 = NBRC 102662]
MTKAEKAAAIEGLKDKFSNVSYFYLTDASTLTVEQVNKFRGLCFEKGVEMKVVKNTLAQKALESFPEELNYDALYESLKGPTAILFTETANMPAKVLKEFRKESEKPILKAAYIESAVYIGDDQIDSLSKLKSKEELLGDVIALLQSPAKTVISSLQSGGQTISGLLKALEERAA